jgi:spore maturation protein CgeB
MVYMNDNAPRTEWAAKSLLYLQNAYGEGCDLKLAELRNHGYDGYAFISQRLLDMHQSEGYRGIFLPFGVDVEAFSPQPVDPALAFEVAYVGNDIKGTERSEAYLEPAADFAFGLFGNWHLPRPRFRLWKNWLLPSYKKRFQRLSRGKIPQERVPVLYGSSKINLNCTTQDCVDWDVITLRTLEVLACDGFLISDRVPAAQHLLSDYVVFTDGHDQLRAQIRHYLVNNDERQRMARAGGEFVRRNFSIKATANKLLKYLQEI